MRRLPPAMAPAYCALTDQVGLDDGRHSRMAMLLPQSSPAKGKSPAGGFFMGLLLGRLGLALAVVSKEAPADVGDQEGYGWGV